MKCLQYIGIILLFSGCMKDDQWVADHRQILNTSLSSGGVFIINEGNFMYGNSTLSYYDTLKREVQNDIFYKINGLPIGDVAQSMTLKENKGYIVVNNSGKVYIIDTQNGKYLGKITGLVSPRYLLFVNNQKGYITDLYAGKIFIFNPANNLLIGSIATPSHQSTEEMVLINKYVFVTCWSGDKTVLVINTETDQLVKEIKTESQPSGIVLDKYDKIWVLCQGSSGTNNQAYLQRIDPQILSIDKTLAFESGKQPLRLTINSTREFLFFLKDGEVMKMSVKSDALPIKSFISIPSRKLYGLGIDPVSEDIYVSDALDYLQSGIIYRYSSSALQKDTFKAGIIPGRFCFK